MVRLSILLSFGLIILGVTGCMQTRHVETTSHTSCSAGCGSEVTHDGTWSERRWCGFWTAQPSKIEP